MSNYTPSTDFAAKDSLLSGNPNKIVKGTEITAELTSIAAAVATKADASSSDAFQAGATTLGATTATSLNNTPIGNSTPSTGAFTTLSATGNTTLGDASTDTVTVNGYMGVGGAGAANRGLTVASTALTSSDQVGASFLPVATSAATSSVNGVIAQAGTAAAAFTATNLYQFRAYDAVKGAGSTITNQHGVYVADQTQGTNNYGITSLVSSGTNKWNIYASGTAANYFAGNVGIGTTAPAATNNVTIGDGAIANNASIYLNGGSNSTKGVGLKFAKAGTAVGFIGSASWLEGGTSDALAFSANSGATVGMRLDSAGNLGLGVTPSAWTTSNSVKALQVGGAASLWSYSTTNAYVGAGYYWNGTNRIYLNSVASTEYAQEAGSHIWKTAGVGTAGNAITFTQAMTLDASGNELLGTTAAVYSAGERLTISAASTKNGIGISVSGGGKGIGIYNAQSSGATNGVMLEFQNSSSVVVGSIQANGTTTTYNTTSDHRLKENVRPADAARFMDIEFVDFEWTDGRHDCGVIAHQLASVYPDLVLGEKDATEVRTVEITPAVPEVKDEDGNVITPAVLAVTEEQTFPVYQQVNYIGLIGRMGTRIQSLQRTVDAQAAMLAAMEARLAALEAQ